MERGEQFERFPSGVRWPDIEPNFCESAVGLVGNLPSFKDRGWVSLGTASIAAVETAAIAVEIAPRCESPIEIDLAVQLIKAIQVIDDPTLLLRHQFKLGCFRYDLSIERETRTKPLLLIECDGKEFHSEQDQIANDRAKDALAKQQGILLLRFSGSEILQNSGACTHSVLKALRMRRHITQSDWNALELARLV